MTESTTGISISGDSNWRRLKYRDGNALGEGGQLIRQQEIFLVPLGTLLSLHIHEKKKNRYPGR